IDGQKRLRMDVGESAEPASSAGGKNDGFSCPYPFGHALFSNSVGNIRIATVPRWPRACRRLNVAEFGRSGAHASLSGLPERAGPRSRGNLVAGLRWITEWSLPRGFRSARLHTIEVHQETARYVPHAFTRTAFKEASS